MPVLKILEQYKGFQIERRSTKYIIITATKINKDKLDELMFENKLDELRNKPKYQLWIDNAFQIENQEATEADLVKIIKPEIDRYDQDKNAIIEEIFIKTHKGIE